MLPLSWFLTQCLPLSKSGHDFKSIKHFKYLKHFPKTCRSKLARSQYQLSNKSSTKNSAGKVLDKSKQKIRHFEVAWEKNSCFILLRWCFAIIRRDFWKSDKDAFHPYNPDKKQHNKWIQHNSSIVKVRGCGGFKNRPIHRQDDADCASQTGIIHSIFHLPSGIQWSVLVTGGNIND